MTLESLEPTTPEREKAHGKLERDLICWFTTTYPDGRPHAVPTWFFRHDERLFVFSRPDAVKVAHVRRGSPVLVHLESGRFGNDVVVLSGTAEISSRSTTEVLREFRDAYETKYAEAIADYGMSLDEIAELFSTAIVFTPERLMAW
ncbi:pyridoxamine 5'-phosphate oxidase family protein [Agromyces sp. H66]|uniref:pyridoxamine 5'-phosphate oxidase family protein n=1 Tax=Agromyces sp. H66 TaxID=2529859 RepID=UPI0010A99AF9|nr:pyridoxamine 5'-phosphate oxidase family protein [Agromyces sp. H66]